MNIFYVFIPSFGYAEYNLFVHTTSLCNVLLVVYTVFNRNMCFSSMYNV